MEELRIAILSPYEKVLALVDNESPEALHYSDMTLTTYLQGSAYTAELTLDRTHADAEKITEGCKLAFRYSGRDYYLNVVSVEWSGYSVILSATGLSFELINEETGSIDSPERSFADYIRLLGAETANITIHINEVGEKKLPFRADNSQTLLARLFSLADTFDAELEFLTKLKDDWSLDGLVLNIYAKSHHGVGRDRTGEILKVGQDIEALTRKSDISELYTAIRPTGKDNLTLSGYALYDPDFPIVGMDIRSPAARDQFPSTLSGGDFDRYIVGLWSCDAETQKDLYDQAVKELKVHYQPKLEYTAQGYIEADVGDTLTLADQTYTPDLYVQCRVIQQELHFPDIWNSVTTFDNFTEVKSQISSGVLEQVQELLSKVKSPYAASISSDNGISFKNSEGTTTLTACVRNGSENATQDCLIRWSTGESGSRITIQANDVIDVLPVSFEAELNGEVVASAEITLVNVSDGADGVDGVSDYLHIKYSDDGGLTFTGNGGAAPGKWMGQYHSTSPVDSMSPADYTWTKISGEDGKDGKDGKDGEDGKDGKDGTNGETQKLVSMTTEYYLSTSSASQAGSSWTTTKPDYVEGKYLWTRIKAVYESPAATAYTQPVLDSDWLHAGQAITKAETAVSSATAASKAAADAVSQANAAKVAADSVAAEIAPLKTGVQEAKDAAADAKKEIADKTSQMLLDIRDTYATKNEVTTMEGDLQAQITANATEIASKVSETVYQQNQKSVDDKLAGLNSDLSSAQSKLTALQSSQSEAASKLAKAEADLKAAQDAVDSLETSQTATASQVEAAKKALQEAQAAVDKAQADVDAANAEIGKVKTDIGDIQDDISSLTSRVTTAETTIKQNSEAIALRATKTEVNDVQRQITDLSVGGRNLLISSETIPANVDKWSKAYTLTPGSDAGHNYFQVTTPANVAVSTGVYGTGCRTKDILAPEETYTYSVWIWISKATAFAFGSLGHMQCHSSTDSTKIHVETYKKITPSSIPANTWTFCTITFTVSERSYMIPYLWYLPADCTFRFSNPKVEKGTMATDWTPAPEDVDTAIADAKSEMTASLEIKADEIVQSVTAVDTKVSGLQQQKVEYYYYLSTSPDTCTGGSWSTTKPAEATGKYIWQKIKTTYVSGASTESSPVRLTGKDGANGANGVTVTSTSTTYQASSSGTTTPTGTWVSSPPATSPGQYLWTKSAITFSNGTTSTSYSVSRNGTNGATGATGATGPTGPQGEPGAPALHISITPVWSGSSCTLTAHVFQGGAELTDTQVVALGALKWYEGATFLANGTQITRTVSLKQVLECRLESGGVA